MLLIRMRSCAAGPRKDCNEPDRMKARLIRSSQLYTCCQPVASDHPNSPCQQGADLSLLPSDLGVAPGDAQEQQSDHGAQHSDADAWTNRRGCQCEIVGLPRGVAQADIGSNSMMRIE